MGKNCKLNQGDFISSLPDDVLLQILSKLTIKEQARTGVLSSRWTHLSRMWTLSSCLNLDAGDLVQSEADTRIKTSKFINSVDQILRMHRGQVIDQLKITFPVDNTVKFEVSLKVCRWIDIAKQKQVKHLYLNYYDYGGFSIFGSTTFPSLVTLCLENTVIANRVVYHLLSSSPNLLKLSIINCSGLRVLKISGSSLKLNHLELIGNATTSLEISAPNLVSFTFIDQMDPFPRICFKNTPLLTRLSCSLGSMFENWHDFYDLLPQLVTLTLTFSNRLWNKYSVADIPNFPMLVNLKQMHIRFLSEDGNGQGLGGLSLFKASPSLYRLWSNLCRLLLRASPYLCRLSFDLGAYIPKHSLIENFPGHEFLEELEIHNFKGFKYEMELLTCIAGSCSSLKKIIIHPDSYETAVELLYLGSTVKKMAAQKELEIVIKAPEANNF